MKKLYNAFSLKALAFTLIAYLINVSLTHAAFGLGTKGKNDWPRFRGQNMDATAGETDVFKFDEGYGLKLAWKKPLGSGYSSVSITDGRAVTMFSDSTFDYVVAFDADNGKQIWRFTIDSTYIGHDGSHNGPISTPIIADDRVYVVGPKGHLISLNVKNGKRIWSSHLVEDHNANEPFYGFATSPVLDGDVLIVETGGQGSTISGFSTDTGELLWSTGNDTVNYQSPITLDIGGQTQLLCIGDKYLYGLEPGTGKMLWEYRHAGGGQVINPVVVDENKIFLQHKWSESVLLEIHEKDSEFIAEEVWKSRNIRGTYNTPVYHGGHLYGYSSRFLTCVNAETGNSVWKSRQPGDGFTIIVDGHLVIVTKKGTLHIAKASPEGYNEVTSLKLFDNLAWTPASFANGRIYARSLTEIAGIDITNVDQLTQIEDTEAVAPKSRFAQFIKELESSNDKEALIDEFMASQDQFPVIEGDDLVHFVFRGEADDLVIVGDMIGFEKDQPMKRVEGTDFFHYSTYLEPDARVSYRFTKNFEENLLDTLNTRKTPGIFGESSWVAMPKWVEPKHLEEPDGTERGRIDTMRFESKILEGSRRIDIYLPSGYDDSETRYPTAYVHWGKLAQNWGKMPNTLDNLIGKSVSPIIVVFIPQLPDSRGREYTRDLKAKYAQMFVEEIIPYIDGNYRTIDSADARANIGMAGAGFMAFYSTLKYPGVFAKVSSQSTFLLTAQEKELKSLASDSDKQPLQIYLDWGKYDIRSPLEGWSIGDANRQFATFLNDRGYDYTGGEVNDGFGWASWKNRTDKILETFFPL